MVFWLGAECRFPRYRYKRQEETMTATSQFDIPPEMRAFAEKSVEQAKHAVEGFIASAQRTLSAFEGQAETARQGAKSLSEKAFSFAERNMTSAFELAERMVQARDAEEMLKVQRDYVRTQSQALAEQAKELGDHTSKIVHDVGKAGH
jgi:phasin